MIEGAPADNAAASESVGPFCARPSTGRERVSLYFQPGSYPFVPQADQFSTLCRFSVSLDVVIRAGP